MKVVLAWQLSQGFTLLVVAQANGATGIVPVNHCALVVAGVRDYWQVSNLHLRGPLSSGRRVAQVKDVEEDDEAGQA